jgi:hypothetical protein
LHPDFKGAFFYGVQAAVRDAMLDKFFLKASANLRGYAARFLTTAFKPEKEGKDYQEVAPRLRAYWKKRLAAIEENPGENLEEAIELTGWVNDSLLEPRETLELLEQTLQLSGGKLGELRYARDFIVGVCELGKGNELIALRCLKLATADENMRMSWALSDERLPEFLESLAELEEDIRAQAADVADEYGRLHPEKFRQIWKKLSKGLERE